MRNMGRKCVVRGCLAQNTSLYSFPDICAEPQRYMAWVKFVKTRRPDWSGPTSIRPVICRAHFTLNCFNSFNQKLTRTAVPTVYPWNWELDGDDPISEQNAQTSNQNQVFVGQSLPTSIATNMLLPSTLAQPVLQLPAGYQVRAADIQLLTQQLQQQAQQAQQQLDQLAQLKQQAQQSTQTASSVLSRLQAALSASVAAAAAPASTATICAHPTVSNALQVLPQGTVIIQPATSQQYQQQHRQPQVVFINSPALQPQLLVPAGQILQSLPSALMSPTAGLQTFLISPAPVAKPLQQQQQLQLSSAAVVAGRSNIVTTTSCSTPVTPSQQLHATTNVILPGFRIPDVELREQTASCSTRTQSMRNVTDNITVQPTKLCHDEGSRYIRCLKKLALPYVSIPTHHVEQTEPSSMDPSLSTDIEEEQMEQQIDKQHENINNSSKVGNHCYGSRCANPACISRHKQLAATVSKLELELLQLRRQLQLAKFSSKSVVDPAHSKQSVQVCSRKPQTSETTTVKRNISTQTSPSSLHKGQTAVANDTSNFDEAWNRGPSAADSCGTITAGLVAVIPSLIGASPATISGITIDTAPPSKRRRMLSQSDATLTHDAATQSEVLSVGTAAVDTQCLARCCKNCAGTCIDKPVLKSVGVSCHMLTVPDTLTSSPSISTPSSELVSMQDSNFMCQPIKSEDLQHERQRVASPTLIRVNLDASVSSRPNCRSLVIVQRKKGIVLVPVQKNSVVQYNHRELPANPT